MNRFSTIAESERIESTSPKEDPRTSASTRFGSSYEDDSFETPFTGGVKPPEWVPNTVSCQKCDTKFSLTFRPHHCRCCGVCVCSKCSNHRWILEYQTTDISEFNSRSLNDKSCSPLGSMDEPSRVCVPFHHSFQKKLRRKFCT